MKLELRTETFGTRAAEHQGCNWGIQMIDGCSLGLCVAKFSVALPGHCATEINSIELHDSFVTVPLVNYGCVYHLSISRLPRPTYLHCNLDDSCRVENKQVRKELPGNSHEALFQPCFSAFVLHFIPNALSEMNQISDCIQHNL